MLWDDSWEPEALIKQEAVAEFDFKWGVVNELQLGDLSGSGASSGLGVVGSSCRLQNGDRSE